MTINLSKNEHEEAAKKNLILRFCNPVGKAVEKAVCSQFENNFDFNI